MDKSEIQHSPRASSFWDSVASNLVATIITSLLVWFVAILFVGEKSTLTARASISNGPIIPREYLKAQNELGPIEFLPPHGMSEEAFRAVQADRATRDPYKNLYAKEYTVATLRLENDGISPATNVRILGGNSFRFAEVKFSDGRREYAGKAQVVSLGKLSPGDKVEVDLWQPGEPSQFYQFDDLQVFHDGGKVPIRREWAYSPVATDSIGGFFGYILNTGYEWPLLIVFVIGLLVVLLTAIGLVELLLSRAMGRSGTKSKELISDAKVDGHIELERPISDAYRSPPP